MVSRPSPPGRSLRRVLGILFSFCLILFGGERESLASLSVEGSVEPGGPRAAERYVLPITPPLDQGDSDLCWIYATLSMLETNYLYRHPGSRISLSRGNLEQGSSGVPRGLGRRGRDMRACIAFIPCAGGIARMRLRLLA